MDGCPPCQSLSRSFPYRCLKATVRPKEAGYCSVCFNFGPPDLNIHCVGVMGHGAKWCQNGPCHYDTHRTAWVQDRTSDTVVLPVVWFFRLMVTPALDKPNCLRSFTDMRRKSRLIQGLGKNMQMAMVKSMLQKNT